MSDLEYTIQMLTNAKIPFVTIHRDITYNDFRNVTTIKVKRGYTFFYTAMDFREDGTLVDMGAYE